MVNVCHMCFKEEESVRHLFSECDFVKQIRRYIYDDISSNQSFTHGYTKGDPWIILNSRVEEVWKRLELMTCFAIWRER
jgi:hypothetical protein